MRHTYARPYDYALAERAFPPSARGTVEFRVFLKSTGKDILEFELLNERSARALRLRFDSAHAGLTFDLGGVEPEPVPFTAGEWHQVKLVFDEAPRGWMRRICRLLERRCRKVFSGSTM